MRKGSSNIETIVSLVLLILITISLFSLITAGNNTEKRIIEQNDIKANARVASAYINVKLKQNDEQGRISVKQNPNTGEDALIINDVSADKKTNTWIYFNNGYLLESTTSENIPPNDDTAYRIAKIDNFKISKEDQKVISEISYIYNGEPHTVSSIVILRSK